jgi:NAD-dependent SIR2 family protein deacetylase
VPYWLDRIEQALRTCTHFAAIGTSGRVWPAAGMPPKWSPRSPTRSHRR